jgi:alkylresorcinol/alkylpyrone synthase
LLRAFEHTKIEQRQLARPLQWYREAHSFVAKNEVYRDVALELAHAAAERALRAARCSPDAVAAVVFVSTTGLSTPSLDSTLIQRLGLPRSVVRLPVWGLGCAGGAAGLARTADLVRSIDGPALLVCVELCSTTFMHDDRSKANLIATALFGDGAAAAVVAPDGEGPELCGAHSLLLDDTYDVMGWDLREAGLKVRFARSIPQIVRQTIPAFVEDCARRLELSAACLQHFVVHPGGAKVLQAYQSALGLSRDRLADAWAVLQTHGNMSSPTVLFVLERFMARTAPTGQPGVILGLGPGFSAEAVMFRW